MYIENENKEKSREREKILNEIELDPMEKCIQLIGDKAKLDAKLKGTYVVYRDDEGNIVQEYPDGKVVKVTRGNNESK